MPIKDLLPTYPIPKKRAEKPSFFGRVSGLRLRSHIALENSNIVEGS